MRNRKLLALLKNKGRISYGWSGSQMDWKVEFRRNTMDGYADGDNLNFAKHERWRTATLGWRGYSMTDSISKQERLVNSGTEAIIGIFSTMATNLMKDMEESFAEELFINGYLPANAKRMHGIESIFGVGTYPGDTSYVLPASQTYAGLSTALGAYGGTWSGTWPSGRGSTDYDFWTPLIVNYGSTSFSATRTWAANCHAAIRYLIIKTKRNKSSSGQLDMIQVDDDMYRTLLNTLDDKERIIVNRNQANSGLVKLGFTDVTNIDGTDVTWEYGCPPDVGYGFNIDNMEIRSLQQQLFEPDGPDYDIATRSYRFAIDFLGNMTFVPKFQGKLQLQTS
jgi:hypothetical protein